MRTNLIQKMTVVGNYNHCKFSRPTPSSHRIVSISRLLVGSSSNKISGSEKKLALTEL